jgi:heme-degrading monooxygenase HmoA
MGWWVEAWGAGWTGSAGLDPLDWIRWTGSAGLDPLDYKGAMSFVSITRLRVRAVRFLPVFGWYAVRTAQQVKAAAGFRGGSLLRDRDWTFWTMTTWDNQEAMRQYMLNGAHREVMPRLMEWCDEASVVHWERTEAEAGAHVPGWAEADARMRAEGRVSKVRYPSAQHAAMGYREPRLTGAVPIVPGRAQR